LKLARLEKRGVFHIADDRDPVGEETLSMKGSQELIGQLDLEAVLAAIGVLALAVDGRLVVEIRLASRHERARRLPASGTARIDMNVDGRSVSLLARPAEQIISVADILDVVDEADHRTGARLRGHNTGRCGQKQSCDRDRESARQVRPGDPMQRFAATQYGAFN
jgi:hypothetical protein